MARGGESEERKGRAFWLDRVPSHQHISRNAAAAAQWKISAEAVARKSGMNGFMMNDNIRATFDGPSGEHADNFFQTTKQKNYPRRNVINATIHFVYIYSNVTCY